MTIAATDALPQAQPAPAGPVFIVGMNGSGTTMLLDSLGRHSALYGFPRETRVLPHLMRIAPRFGPLDDPANFERLWNHTTRLTPFLLANDGVPMPLPADRGNTAPTLAGLIDLLIRCFAQTGGKVRWCEKSPHYAQHMLTLSQLFPTARFVHVIRDGRDCARSFHRRWRRSPELAITRWKQLVRATRAQEEALGGRYLEVRYEALTAEPEPWMRRICTFLDLPFEATVLESSHPYHAPPDGGTRGLHPNSGRWQQHFSPRRARRLERIAGRQLAELGYPAAFPDADETPASWRRACWRGSDAVGQQLREIGLKLRGRIARPWSTILSRPFDALRQGRENHY